MAKRTFEDIINEYPQYPQEPLFKGSVGDLVADNERIGYTSHDNVQEQLNNRENLIRIAMALRDDLSAIFPEMREELDRAVRRTIEE